MVLAFVTLIGFSLFAATEGQLGDVVLQVGSFGAIRGYPGETVTTARPFHQFLGIPFAKSTAGAGRFIPAEHVERLERDDGDGIFNASTFMDPCAQPPTGAFPVGSDSEDCLGINIWTPNVNKEGGRLFPVIVFVHGGSFMDSTGNMYSGGRLLERDLVVVSFNYRLGILGFFCMDTSSAPGNPAMYDMVLALSWVKQHIEYFGGNPDLVTIAGQSAGSAAVVHLVLSPMAKGLFHRAIAMSGSALNTWGTVSDPKPHSIEVSRYANCYLETDEGEPWVDAIVGCMKSVNASVLTRALTAYQTAERKEARIGFGPVSPAVQRYQSVPPFLSQEPITILKEGTQSNVPLMMGSTRHDGSFVLNVLYYQYLLANNLTQDSVFLKTRLVPNLLQALGISDETMVVYESLSYIYLGEARKSGNFTEMIPGLIDLHGVFFFKAGTFRTVELHSSIQSKSFWYSFDFFGNNSIFNGRDVIPSGIGHADDMFYLFPFTNLNEDEMVISNMLVNYWANFALTGDPNMDSENSTDSSPRNVPEWPAYSIENPLYIQIGTGEYLNTTVTVLDNYPEAWKDASLELMEPPPEETGTTTEESLITPTPITISTSPQPSTTTTTTARTSTTVRTTTKQPSRNDPKYEDMKKERNIFLSLFVVFLAISVAFAAYTGFLFRKSRNLNAIV